MCNWPQDYDIKEKNRGLCVFLCVCEDILSNNKICWTHHTLSETVLVLLEYRDEATELSDPIELHCQDMPIIIKAQEQSECVLTSKPVKELDKYTFNFLSVSRDPLRTLWRKMRDLQKLLLLLRMQIYAVYKTLYYAKHYYCCVQWLEFCTKYSSNNRCMTSGKC